MSENPQEITQESVPTTEVSVEEDPTQAPEEIDSPQDIENAINSSSADGSGLSDGAEPPPSDLVDEA